MHTTQSSANWQSRALAEPPPPLAHLLTGQVAVGGPALHLCSAALALRLGRHSRRSSSLQQRLCLLEQVQQGGQRAQAELGQRLCRQRILPKPTVAQVRRGRQSALGGWSAG